MKVAAVDVEVTIVVQPDPAALLSKALAHIHAGRREADEEVGGRLQLGLLKAHDPGVNLRGVGEHRSVESWERVQGLC